jgi:hypothetical protein
LKPGRGALRVDGMIVEQDPARESAVEKRAGTLVDV